MARTGRSFPSHPHLGRITPLRQTYPQTLLASATGVIPYANPTVLTVTGNEITDATRLTGTSGDGLSIPNGFGIWNQTINLCTNGGFESNTTGWNSFNSATLVSDTTRAKFGGKSGKLTLAAIGNSSGAFDTIATLASGAIHTLSVWVYLDPTSGPVIIRATGPVGGGTDDFQGASFSTTGVWTRLTLTFTPTATNTFRLRIQNAAGAAALLWIDGVQIEQNGWATPYVETNGASATRNESYVTGPGSLLTETQGWIATRVTLSGPSSTTVGIGMPMFAWAAISSNKFYLWNPQAQNGNIKLMTNIRNGTEYSVSVLQAWSAGDTFTVIGAWTPSQVLGSINGANFSSTTRGAAGGAALASTFHIGGNEFSGNQVDNINGLTFHWFATGVGTLTNADSTTFNNYGNTPDPLLAGLSSTAAPTLVWNASTSTAQTPWVSFKTINFNRPGANPTALTLSGNELTDVTRLAGTQGDGLAIPDGYGIWEGTTNLITNGGFESNTTGWVNDHAPTVTRDSTTLKFGTTSLKVVTPGTFADEGVHYSPLSMTVGQKYTLSFWAKHDGTATSLDVAFDNRGAGGTLQFTTVALSSSWAKYTYTITAAETTVTCNISIDNNVATARTYWIDGVQVEQKAYATPYVETNGGTASRSAARVQAPSSFVDSSQCWVAFRVAYGFSSTATRSQSSALLNFGDDTNNRLRFYLHTNNTWNIDRVQGGNSNGQNTTAQIFNSGDNATVVGTYTSSKLQLSLNGSSLSASSVSNTFIPTLATNLFDIGQGGATEYFDGPILWFACGKGTLTNADAITFNNYGNTIDPALTALSSGAAPTGMWTAASGTMQQWFNPIKASAVPALGPANVSLTKSAAVTVAATLPRSIGKIISRTITSSVSVIKGVGKIMPSVSIAAAITITKSAGKILTVSASGALSILRGVNKNQTVGITVTPTLFRSIAKTVASTVAITISTIKGTGKIISSVSIGVAIASKSISKRISVNIAGAPLILKAISHSLILGVTASTSLLKSLAKNLTNSITATVSVRRFISKTISINIEMTPIIKNTISKALTISIGVSSLIFKTVIKLPFVIASVVVSRVGAFTLSALARGLRITGFVFTSGLFKITGRNKSPIIDERNKGPIINDRMRGPDIDDRSG